MNILDPHELVAIIDQICAFKVFEVDRKHWGATQQIMTSPITPSKWSAKFGDLSQKQVENRVNEILAANGYPGHAQIDYNHKGNLELQYIWKRDKLREGVEYVADGVKDTAYGLGYAVGRLILNILIWLVAAAMFITAWFLFGDWIRR